MASYREFIDHVERRASAVDQKARSLNGKLRDAISALSEDPKADPEGILTLAGLSAMSEVARESRCGNIRRELYGLVQRMSEADRELVDLSEKIDSDILAIHSSILSDCVVPEAESERLARVFHSWQDASLRLETSRRQLEELALRVDDAADACERLASAPRLQAPGKGASAGKKGGPEVAADTEGGGAISLERQSLESLLEMRCLLIGIASMYLRRPEFGFGLKYCCSKIAACRIAGTPSPRSIRYHDKPRIKHAMSVVSKKYSAFSRGEAAKNEGMRQFFRLLESIKSVHALIPAEVFRQEAYDISRFNGALDMAIRSSTLPDFATMGSFGMEAAPGWSELMRQATGYGKVFMIDFFERFYDTSEYNLYEIDAALASKDKALMNSLRRLLDVFDEGLFYTQAEVSDLLHRYSMDEYMSLIPPFAFAHEGMLPPEPEDKGCDDGDQKRMEEMLLLVLQMQK